MANASHLLQMQPQQQQLAQQALSTQPHTPQTFQTPSQPEYGILNLQAEVQQSEQQPQDTGGGFLTGTALLAPPQDRLYASFAPLLVDVKNFARSQGYAVVIESSLNRDVEGNYRRYNLCCAKGGRTYKRQSSGQRNSRTSKTGCPMKMKAIREKARPYDDKWHLVIQCAEHNHGPFAGERPGELVPPQFRKIDEDGRRWLMIMHREAQLTLRQLTIGIRISFGDRYQYVRKSDVRNLLIKVKKEEEKRFAAEQKALGLPEGAKYTLLPPIHQSFQSVLNGVERVPPLPPDMRVLDPELESDGEDEEDL